MNSDILLTVCFNARYFVFLTVHFYIKVCFTLILNKLMETPFLSLGRAARRSNVSDYVGRHFAHVNR